MREILARDMLLRAVVRRLDLAAALICAALLLPAACARLCCISRLPLIEAGSPRCASAVGVCTPCVRRSHWFSALSAVRLLSPLPDDGDAK